MLFTKAIINLVINMLLSEKMKEQERFSISKEQLLVTYLKIGMKYKIKQQSKLQKKPILTFHINENC